MPKAAKFELEFIKKKKESKDAYTFHFKRPKELNFSSGQYFKIFLKINDIDVRGSYRYFTISSSPENKKYLSITTRIIKSSFKMELNNLKIGDRILAFGPIGYFTFDPEKQKNVVLIAGGIGVTPFHSIIKGIEFKKNKTKITLFNSFDFKENVVFHKDLKKIESKNPAVKIIYTLTKDKNKYLDFEKGRISKKMIKKYIPDFSDAYYYITGPEKMTKDLFKIIKQLGVSEEKIFKEDFPGY